MVDYTNCKTELPKLKVFNSLTKEKEIFVPKHADTNIVTWYMCGPTVYDHSHMGHARTYIGFDIIKRLLRDYFGYNVKLCMNITDIDDKIIRKANENQKKFDEISRHFETEFLEDMKNLNVELPEVITRVSEFVPEIVRYIEKIIANGYAYESNGSVYFDVQKFNDGKKHRYAKLEPTSVDDKEKLLEGEGVLTGNLEAQDKRNMFDFALWKKSKENEPMWDSPWGQGRPGWHIECSAMASEFFKECPLDIHSGGVDLRFPHHDNEIAQSEAYYDCDEWMRYFLHTGHLHIHGKKMAKTLKNFITIKEILKEYNARQIRFMFLIHQWDTLMNYTTEKSLPEAVQKERSFSEFFKNVKAILRLCDVKSTAQKWNERDYELNEMFKERQNKVHLALCDNFDTPSAVQFLFELITSTNSYLQQDPTIIKLPLVKSISRYVFKIMKAFGVYDEDVVPAVGEQAQLNYEEILTPLMNVLSKFRDQVKEKAGEGPKVLFQLSDELRDDILPYLGIRLEDRAKGQEAIWKLEEKEVLIRERENKLAEKQKKEEEKRARTELENKKKSTPPQEWFRIFFNDQYSQFDEQGIPTHDSKGKELSDSIKNKLKKEWNSQSTKYQKWLTEQNKEQTEEAKTN